MNPTSRRTLLGATLALPFIRPAKAVEKLREIRLDYATDNPLSVLIKERR